MTRDYVAAAAGEQTLRDLPPASRDEIERMALAAGLRLPPALMDELCKSYPAFEAMVRRLPRARERFDEPAHHCVDAGRIDATRDRR